ncbi:hypothetical protein BASA62_003426 [Batrachochytrium salamandrivorans]|nr:hypothetical protein BASA62_003426 [Batrachochytrium salamandrivorans]
MEQQIAQQLPQSDPALEAFDRLRFKRVEAEFNQTASDFLAEFQSIAASLKPDERIELQDVNSIIPLLINNCPDLASLEVEFEHHSEFDFVSSLLEHPSNRIKVLEMPEYAKGGSARFFAALGQSQVSALTLFCSPVFAQSLHEYLAKDLLVRLKVFYSNSVPSEMTASLANCTRLAKLEMLRCEFSQSTVFTHLPKSITKLVFTTARLLVVWIGPSWLAVKRARDWIWTAWARC